MTVYDYVTMAVKRDDGAGQKNDDTGLKDDGEEEGGSDQTSQDWSKSSGTRTSASGVVGRPGVRVTEVFDPAWLGQTGGVPGRLWTSRWTTRRRRARLVTSSVR